MSRTKELTVIMPCLNEAETLERCIRKAQKCMNENGIEGEVLIADNGSTDGSVEIAKNCGARVVHIHEKGYGAALRGGTIEACGKYCIMGDADDSYDFSQLMPYMEKLREGYDLVMGNRFKGGIEQGAMPFLHRYLGTPVISFIGRLFYHNKIGDFNCGMRGYNTERIMELKLKSTGMEYASEMIVESALHKYRIVEVPTTLSVDGRSREPHLSTWSDGWRHLKFLLMHSPDWLFLIPGLLLILLGVVIMAILIAGPAVINDISFDINTMLFAAGFILSGVNAVLFSCYTKMFASQTGYIPITKSMEKISNFTMEKGIIIGLMMILAGLIASVISIVIWGKTSFGNLNPDEIMRITIPAQTSCVIGIELVFGGFFLEILKIKHN